MKRLAMLTATSLAALLGCSDPSSVEEEPPVAAGPSTVRGVAYLDSNGDGALGTSDVTIAGAPLSLVLHASGDTVARRQTGVDGGFTFDQVTAGSYRLVLDLGPGRDSLAVPGSATPLVVAPQDTVTTQVRVVYAGTETSIVAARALPVGTRVIVAGVALTATDAFGDSTLHLAGAGAAIRAFRVSDAIAAGDSIRLIGTLAADVGQPVIVASATVIQRAGGAMPAPAAVSTGEAARAANGTLDAAQVTVSGVVASVGSAAPGITHVTIDDGSGTLVLELLAAVGFTTTTYEIDQTVSARGVLVPSSDGTRWHLRPRAAFEARVTASITRCSNGFAGEFPCHDIDLMAHIPVYVLDGSVGGIVNDLWGWTDPQTGREYALVGLTTGTSFIDVTDALRPIVVANLPKTAASPSSAWRDVKVYQDHAYIVADRAGSHGMQVLDLTRLRQYSDTVLQLTPDAVYTQISSAHNIVINEATGYAYAVGANGVGNTCGGGLHMIDVRVPTSPAFAGCFVHTGTARSGTGYTHDAQCVRYTGPDARYTGREICFGSNELSLSIADVTDKTAPQVLSRGISPVAGYLHQGWLTDDHRYFYMDDELDEIQGAVSRTRTLIWDVADLEDPQLVATYSGVEPSSDHNLYIRGNLMYQSNYASGLRIVDVSTRLTPAEVAFFDTTPDGSNGPGLDGSWSNYPFFASGVIIVSSMKEGLFVLKRR